MRIVIGILFLLSILPAGLPAATAPPARIVSLGPVITEMIYLLEADERLIADTAYCLSPEDARHKTKIGTVIQFNVEKIVSLSPDLVLASPLARERQLKLLQKLGIPVRQVENPETFDKMCSMMISLGRLLDKIEKARSIVAKARREVAAIVEKTADLPRRKVFMQIGLKPLHTSPQNTFIHEYIEFAGGINVAADAATGNYSREKVLEKNPDVILIATMGSSKAGAKKEKKTWRSYSSLSAAANGRIYILDPEIICGPTPVSFVEGLKEIARLIHPELKVRNSP